MAACGDNERSGPPPVDEEAPTADAARFVPLGDGGLRLEVDAADVDGGCGVTAVHASIVGTGMRLAYGVDLEAPETPGGAWFTDLPATRCGPSGEVWLGFLSVTDGGGNVREFRYARGEGFLQATDRDVELPIPTGEVASSGAGPTIVEVVAPAPGRVEVVHDGDGCGPFGGWVHARGPDGDDIRLDHVGSLPGRQLYAAPGSLDCLAEGTWQVDEVVLTAGFGAGDVRLEEEDGGPPLPTFEVAGTGLSERLPVAVEALRLEAVDPGFAEVIVDLRDASCPVVRRSGELRRLAAGDRVIRRVPFGDDGLARLPECAGPGTWWLSSLHLRDGAGGVWPWRLWTDDPSRGYREDPALDVPRLVSPFDPI